MGFTFLGDPDLDPSQEFDRCEAGTYKVSGIKKWITSNEENGNPVWIFDEMRQDMVAKLELTRVDGETGPAWSGTALDLKLLVRAFGGDIKSLPKKTNSTEFLVKAEAQIEKSGNTVTAEVGSTGWVSYIHEATPPEGYYQFKLVEARSMDGTSPIEFQENKYGNQQIMLFFEVVGNMVGNETPYEGFRVVNYLQNGFDGAHEGRPNLLLTEKGAKSFAARRVEKLAVIFAPEVLVPDYEWDDPENPIVEIIDVALANEHIAIGQYAYNNPRKGGKPRLVLDFDSLAPVDSVEVEEEQPEEDVEQQELVESDVPPNLFNLVEWIHEGEEAAFKVYPPKTVDDVVLTAKGKTWANKHLPEFMRKANLEHKAKALADFTEEECAALLNVIWGNKLF